MNPPILADGFESGDVSAWSGSQGLCDGDIGVFLSSSLFPGDFGGLAFADATCQSLGTAAMPGSGPWVAWLSDAGTAARDRIPRPGSGRAYVRASQPATVIANDLTDLTDGNLDLEIGNFDENGNPSATTNAWTGTVADGTVGPGTCLDWTSNSIAVEGTSGSSFFTDSLWTNWSGAACDQALHIYCFGALGALP